MSTLASSIGAALMIAALVLSGGEARAESASGCNEAAASTSGAGAAVRGLLYAGFLVAAALRARRYAK